MVGESISSGAQFRQPVSRSLSSRPIESLAGAPHRVRGPARPSASRSLTAGGGGRHLLPERSPCRKSLNREREVDLLPRAEVGSVPAGGAASRREAAGRWSQAGPGRRQGLLVLERGAVDVAGMTIGLAAEAQDGGVVDEAVGDGDGLRRRREKFSPLLER
jgi:hypothetical protein